MKALRWLTLVAGVLLLILGFVTLGTPVANLVAISVYVCSVVLLYGLMLIVSYFSFSKQSRSAWMLVIGILSALLGGWMLFSGGFVKIMAVLPFVFAIWLLVSNISLAVSSIDLKNAGAKGWGLQMVLGIIGIILGFVLLFDPVVSALTISYSLALMFIFRGVSDIIFFFSSRSFDSKKD